MKMMIIVIKNQKVINHLNNIEKENEYIKPYDQDNLDRNNDNIQIDNDKIEQKNASEVKDFYFSSIISKDDIPLILSWMPKKVKNFDCSLCDLKSLVGAPEIVTGDFTCWNSALLTTLNGAPEKVGGDFDCSCCDSLKSIKSLPKEIGGDLHIDGRFKGKIPKDVIIKGNIEYE